MIGKRSFVHYLDLSSPLICSSLHYSRKVGGLILLSWKVNESLVSLKTMLWFLSLPNLCWTWVKEVLAREGVPYYGLACFLTGVDAYLTWQEFFSGRFR